MVTSGEVNIITDNVISHITLFLSDGFSKSNQLENEIWIMLLITDHKKFLHSNPKKTVKNEVMLIDFCLQTDINNRFFFMQLITIIQK